MDKMLMKCSVCWLAAYWVAQWVDWLVYHLVEMWESKLVVQLDFQLEDLTVWTLDAH